MTPAQEQRSTAMLPVGWEQQIIRAYRTFGAISHLLDALTPEMRSAIAHSRHRDTREGHEGEFLEERDTVIPERKPRASTDISISDMISALTERAYNYQLEEADKPQSSTDHRGSAVTRTVLQMLDANDPPTVLKTGEFEKYEGEPITITSYGRFDRRTGFTSQRDAEVTEFWRTIWPPGQSRRPGEPIQTSEAKVEEVLRRTAYDSAEESYVGSGVFGDGIYIGEKATAAGMAGDYEDLRTQKGTGVVIRGANTVGAIRFKLKPGTRLIDWHDVPYAIQTSSSAEIAAWVLLNGYHGINGTHNNDRLGGLNILDRSRLIMEYND